MAPTKNHLLAALCVDLCIGFAKAGVAVHTRSVTLLAEAVRSFANAVRRLPLSGRAGDGEPGARTWSLFVGALLLAACGAIVFVMGFVRLLLPEALRSPGIALAVLGISLALEAIPLYGALRRLRATPDVPPAIRFRRALASAAPERLTAIIGTLASMLCVAAAAATGNLLWDAMGALIAGAIMLATIVTIGAEIRALAAGAPAVAPIPEQDGRG